MVAASLFVEQDMLKHPWLKQLPVRCPSGVKRSGWQPILILDPDTVAGENPRRTS